MLTEVGVTPSNDMYEIALRSVPCCNASSRTILEISYVGGSLISVGDISGWQGKWMDIVIEAQANPCSSGTCDYGAVGTFPANTGVFNVWVSDPDDDTQDANGCYDMIQVNSANNVPVGPSTPLIAGIHHRLKLYAFGWGNNATKVYGPIAVAFDENRWGYVDEGADFSEVHPKRCAQP
jgi:hypothetical protein